MSTLPTIVEQKLADRIYQRDDPDAVEKAAKRLHLALKGTFREFYRTYEGTFGSDTIPFELLDISDVVDATEAAREVHGFPDRYLVLTELMGGEVLVFDAVDEGVYQVDFEGGDEELKAGEATPTWKSFEQFLIEYFGE